MFYGFNEKDINPKLDPTYSYRGIMQDEIKDKFSNGTLHQETFC